MSRLRTAALLAGLIFLTAATSAAASWSVSNSGAGYTKATSLAAGNQPSVSVSGRNVTVNWTASSGAPLQGYIVKRYDTNGQLQTIGANCSGTLAGTSCVEKAVTPGSWRYTVTPVRQNWRGAESAQSATAVVGSPALTLNQSTVTSLPAALTGQIANFVENQTVTFRLDDAQSGQVLTGSITPNQVPGDGTAQVSVTLPSLTPNGVHTIYAIGNQGDQAGASGTVEVPLTINTSAWALEDASSGTPVIGSDATAFDDNRVFPTDAGFTAANFNNAFATSRYYQWDYSSALPAEQATSNVSFDFRFRSNGGTNVACFYFDVISAGNVIGTHGSTTPGTASSQWCTNGTEKLVSTPLPEVTSTSIANGLRIRVYGYESGKKPIFVDQATVSGTTQGKSFSLYETTGVNAADTSPQTLPWSLAAEDGNYLTNGTNWLSTFSTTRYAQLTFPSYVPSTGTIDSVSFELRYQAAAASTICFYLSDWAGSSPPPAAAIGTHPDPPGTNGLSCATGTSTWVRETIPLPEVDTPEEANGLVLRTYFRTSAGSTTKARVDYANLKIIYH
jgi:hypothetical protein